MKKEFNFKNEAILRLNQRLCGILRPEQVLADEDMSVRTTFRTGGAAGLFVEINNSGELKEALAALRAEGFAELNRDFYLLGNGSNVLVSDGGIGGVVLHLSKDYSHMEVRGNLLVCEAGAALAAVARRAYESALTGFEFASGIPGSLGGAIVMNAGAYGGEMRQVVKSVRLMAPDGEIIEKSADEMKFSYRHSLVKEQPLIVLGVTIGLEAADQADIRAKMEDLAARRRDRQPLEYPSAGSTFKRPEGHFAAKLIEEAGLKGFSVGGAQVSGKHCGFVVNMGNATSADIYALIREVQKRVEESSGVHIEPEVILWGDFCG